MRDGFIQADYLELTGNEYINTWFNAGGKTRIVLDCMQLDTSKTFCFYCGARTAVSATDAKANTLFFVNNAYRQDFYGTSKSTSGYYSDANKRLVIDNNMGAVKIGSDYTLSMTASSTTSSGSLILGASYQYSNSSITNLDNYARMRIYSCQIYDNGTLVRDFVPCLEESSEHIGLYDNVNDIFYRPFGTGWPFIIINKPIIGKVNANNGIKPIIGGYVNIGGSYKKISQAYIFKEEQYTSLDYIESNGIQTIDTGIQPSDDLVTTIDFQCLSDGVTENAIFGSSWSVNGGYILEAYSAGGGLRWHYGGAYKDVAIDATTRNTFICSKDGVTVNGTAYTFTPTGSNSTNNIHIFTTPDSADTTRNGRFKLYRLKMVKNGVTVRFFTPVKRNSDNMIGLYEKIENKFYCSDSSTKDKIPPSKRSYIETTYADSDHNTNAKWVWNNSTNYAANAKVSMNLEGVLTAEANILMKPGDSDAYKLAKYGYDYGYSIPYTNLLSSNCTLTSIKITNSSGTEIASSNPTMTVGDDHVMRFSVTSTALMSAAAGNYTLTVTVFRNSYTCRFDIPITKIDVSGRYFSAGSETVVTSYTSLMKMHDGGQILNKAFTAEALVPTWTITSKVSGASYGFSLTSDGYYTSNNAGVNSSAAVCRVNFTNNTGAAYTVTFNCINYAEANYDYGIIGKINTALGTSSSADSTYTKSFKGSSSSGVQTVTLSVPTGTSYVDIKYLKDSSQSSNNDSLKFKIVV